MTYILVVGGYFGLLAALAVYGVHRWYLVGLYFRHLRAVPRPDGRFEEPPRVTVQLPLYNEMYVARRLIDAVCRLDYPRERLEVQVLDDSTDETTAIAREQVALWQSRGVDVKLLHRDDRRGFKAGALAAGLAVAKGEFVAVFDADFVPSAGFLERLLPHFTDPGVGMVQARWDHINREHSALTRVQAMLLDGHFVIEHTARNRSGRFFNFNGTAGIWRRSAIEQAGGWQHDTLTEDLDLSYRAQLAGWRFVFVKDELAPAELPVEMGAFKSQQHRWAKGSIQTARKLLPRLWRSRQPPAVKLESTFHLTANVAYLAMQLLTLCVVPAVWMRGDHAPWQLLVLDLPLFGFTTLSVTGLYLVSQQQALGSWTRALRWVPFLMAIGIGLSVNNTRAVLEALAGRDSAFRRTPKYNLARGERAVSRRYRVRVHPTVWFEAALALYFSVAVVATAVKGYWGAVPFLMLFQFGYAYTALASLGSALPRRPAGTSAPAPAKS